jgi:mono/diheme cytochrome c family protein/uncharacterized membrane protein
MNRRIVAIAWVATFGLFGETAVAQEPKPETDLAARVQAIFATRCIECHGPRLKRPRGGVHLDDPGRLAADPDLVVPANPEGSTLWEVVRDGEMPPPDARAGPLNEQEKEAIRAWIASLPPAASQASPGAMAASPPALVNRVLGFLGRFHILVIHFPIALLAAAALAELIATVRGVWLPEPAVRFCVVVGAAAAVLAAALGWLHADIGGYGNASAGALALHRWLGTAAAVWALALVLASERESRRGQRSVLFRSLLWSCACLVAVTAHFGGVMVHGSTFLDW